MQNVRNVMNDFCFYVTTGAPLEYIGKALTKQLLHGTELAMTHSESWIKINMDNFTWKLGVERYVP